MGQRDYDENPDEELPQVYSVDVSSELLAQLSDDWSEPVRLRIVSRDGSRLTMEVRSP